MKQMTRSRVIQNWFAAVLLILVAWMAFGVAMTISTGAMLLVMSVVPPTIVLLLWPAAQPLTIADVLRGAEPALDGPAGANAFSHERNCR